MDLFQETLQVRARSLIWDLPMSDFQQRYPTLFSEKQLSPTIKDEERPPQPISPKATRKEVALPSVVPPESRYDTTNPLWKKQSIVWAFNSKKSEYVWESMWKPRQEYVHHQCDRCKLFGHIKWDCPTYQCVFCFRNCGHTPIKCSKNPWNHHEVHQVTQMAMIPPQNLAYE